MSDTKLLPCPFCGSKRPKFERHCNVNFWIACRCGASMDNKTDEAKAIAAWNTRALTPEQAAARVLIGTVSPNDDGTWDVAFAPDNTTWVTVSPDQVPRAPRVGDTLIVLPPRVIGLDGAA